MKSSLRIKLEDYGYNKDIQALREQHDDRQLILGRVCAAHRERYIVSCNEGEVEAEITGNLRFSARLRQDYPVVGDWVLLIPYGPESALIQSILPRKTLLAREAINHKGEVQAIAANVDCAFIVMAVDRDFSINRVERYMSICLNANVKPVIVISKTDLAKSGELEHLMAKLKARIHDTPIIAISNETMEGYSELTSIIQTGKTYCMLGSSGVGKSSLLNRLAGKQLMATMQISESTSRGRHTTSHRELVVLNNGGILIDNPGMREIGVADGQSGIEKTFDLIAIYGKSCKFIDCTHTTESGCRVIEAVESGEIEQESYENFLKLEKERAHYEASLAERKRKDKAFGKMHKNYKKDRQKGKPGYK